MIRSWAQLCGTLVLAVAMLGAPCRDCFPRGEAKAPCGHDCCPKPKPAKESRPCSWQPAGFDALETAKVSVGPDWHAMEPPAEPAGLAESRPSAAPAEAAWHGPPRDAPAVPVLPLRI